MFNIRYISTIILLTICPALAQAYNLRQILKRDGLSNSAIQSICQDDNGVMWFGSVDGLNIYDGRTVERYRSTSNGNTLSGNLIECVMETGDDVFWIQTNYGLDRLDRRRMKVASFPSFHANYKLRTCSLSEVFFVVEDGSMVYYNDYARTFDTLRPEGTVYTDILDYTIDKENVLWIFGKSGKVLTYDVSRDGRGVLSLSEKELFDHERRIVACFHEGDTVYFVDETSTLYQYDTASRQKYYIDNIAPLMARRGEISAIVRYNGDFFIGFKTDGLVCLRHTPESSRPYRSEVVGISSGIFCLVRDRRQDIIWIGTDGQGVYIYSDDPWSVDSIPFESFSHNIEKPARCLLLDDDRSLWVGTKGDGMIRIPDYEFNGRIDPAHVVHYGTRNSELFSNSVYCMEKSDNGLFWIGTEEGLNYYGETSHRIKRLNVYIEDEPLRYVHGVVETVDNTLWIATVGTGIVKVRLEWHGGEPVVIDAERFTILDGGMSSNYFFSVYREDDSTLWFGNRGRGAFRMDVLSSKMESVPLSGTGGNRTLDDVFCITDDNDGNFWFGTSFGLVKRAPDGTLRIFNEKSGFPNNTVHGILRGEGNDLWLSTNLGIIKFDTRLETFLVLAAQSGLDVIEYSDGAYFRDTDSGLLLFGGINGFTAIRQEDHVRKDLLAPVLFDRLAIFGEEYNIYDFTSGKDDGELRLDDKENFFSISLSVVDHVNGGDLSYLYRIEELDDAWINNAGSNTIYFTDMSPGHYTLQVKYRNRETGHESAVYPLSIHISPPWYMTATAYAIYALAAAAAIRSAIVRRRRRRQAENERIMDDITREHQKEVYESKLNFFTRIAHELCTPLTLIHGSGKRMLTRKGSDPFTRKYSGLVLRNAERMNDLMDYLIDFRNMESGQTKPHIDRVDVSALATWVCENFEEMAETGSIAFSRDIPRSLSWNSDGGFLTTIITNLVSNAFSFTEKNGSIALTASSTNDTLIIRVSNTGRGIRNVESVFDRYQILDRFENLYEGADTRNTLGLAISYDMIRLLHGEINVDSVPGQSTDFIVTLPFMPLSGGDAHEEVSSPQTTIVPVGMHGSFDIPEYEFDPFRQTVMVIDDDPEMLWFISELFAHEYNVIPVDNSEKAHEIVSRTHPNVIICDMTMTDVDGIAIARMIKSDSRTSHVPLILISSKHNIETQIEGFEAGAEMYITKPFSDDYLKTVVRHLISRKETLKDYFSSPISAYQLTEGKFTHIDHRRFVQQVLDVINSNIGNKGLSAGFIAAELNMSTRHLYRRITEAGAQSPLEMIRECRLHIATDLLQNSRLTIDEIIYKSGFSNRGPFFKAFADKYGCTPGVFRERISSHNMK